MSAIDRAAVAVHLKAIAKDRGAVTVNRARSTLSAMFAWAIGEGLCEANPVIGTNKKDEGSSRARVLTDAELAAVWNAAPDNDYGTIVKLLMPTAQRRDEIGGLEWSEIDVHAKMISLPASRTKNNRPHDVPLSSAALALIEALPRRAGRSLVFGSGQGGYSGVVAL
jgi:integrase